MLPILVVAWKVSAVADEAFRRCGSLRFFALRFGSGETNEEGIGFLRTEFHQLDFSVDPVPFVPVDVVLCINVLLVACFDTRMRCWRTVTNQVASGGWLLLVVPSLESILMQQHLERESLLQSGQGCETSLQDCMPDGSTAIDLHQGVHLLEGFRTKHYFKEELVHLLSEHHFEKIEIRRLEYRPVGDKYQSWDWFVCARRTVVD